MRGNYHFLSPIFPFFFPLFLLSLSLSLSVFAWMCVGSFVSVNKFERETLERCELLVFVSVKRQPPHQKSKQRPESLVFEWFLIFLRKWRAWRRERPTLEMRKWRTQKDEERDRPGRFRKRRWTVGLNYSQKIRKGWRKRETTQLLIEIVDSNVS